MVHTTLPQRILVRTYCLLSLARLRTAFPSVFAFLLGWQATARSSLSESVLDSPVWFFDGLILSFFIGTVVNLGNSVTDVQEDKINLPHRVRVARMYGLRRLLQANRVLSWVMVLMGILTFKLPMIIITPISVWLMNQYSFTPFRFKRRPFLSLVDFSGAVGAPLMFGFYLQQDQFVLPPVDLIWLWLLISLWFGLFGSAKNLQDYEGDKRAGIKTTATIFRSKQRAVLFTASGLVLSLLMFVVPVITGHMPAQILWVLGWVGFIVPVMLLNNQFKDHPEQLRRLQSLFFMYPVFFLVTLNLILFPAFETVFVCGALIALLLLFEKMGLDARRVGCYENVQKMLVPAVQPQTIA